MGIFVQQNVCQLQRYHFHHGAYTAPMPKFVPTTRSNDNALSYPFAKYCTKGFSKLGKVTADLKL